MDIPAENAEKPSIYAVDASRRKFGEYKSLNFNKREMRKGPVDLFRNPHNEIMWVPKHLVLIK